MDTTAVILSVDERYTILFHYLYSSHPYSKGNRKVRRANIAVQHVKLLLILPASQATLPSFSSMLMLLRNVDNEEDGLTWASSTYVRDPDGSGVGLT